jgi:nitrogen fixation protein NifX
MALRRHLRINLTNEIENTMQTKLKFAFASSDLKQVDQHFGSAQKLVIYAVDMDESNLLEVVEFTSCEQDGSENKLIDKFKALQGCAAVYCQAVGGSAIRQLTMQGIQPLKVSAGAEIKTLIENIQQELRAGPSTWLAKAIYRQQPKSNNRFDDMAAEGWSE